MAAFEQASCHEFWSPEGMNCAHKGELGSESRPLMLLLLSCETLSRGHS